MKQRLTTTFSRNVDQTVIVLALVIGSFTLLFVLRTAEQTGDSLLYAISAQTGTALFNPHHLLYTPIVHLLFRAFSSIFESGDVIFAAQFHNITWAAVTVVASYFIVRHLLGSSLVGVLAAVCLLVAQGFWFHSTQVEGLYVAATGCLALLVAILVLRRNTNLGLAQVAGISLLLAMSVFYHQSNVLFTIPLAYYLIATQGRQAWKTLAAILSLAGFIVLLTYIIVFLSIRDNITVGEFIRFCLSYFHYPNPDWGTFRHFSIDGGNKLLDSQFGNIVSFTNDALNGLATFAMFAVSVGIAVWNIMQIARHAAHDKLRGFLLLWLVVYLTYFLWWLPQERHFFVATLVPILLLAFLTLKDLTDRFVRSNSGRRIAIAAIPIVVAVILFAANLQVILPKHQSRGLQYARAAELVGISTGQCLILYDFTIGQHLKYYFDVDRYSETWPALLRFYQHDEAYQLPDLEEEECIIVPWYHVTPKWVVAGFDGYSHPSEWLGFMEWLFDFEYDSQQRLVAARAFEVVDGDEGIWILISSNQRDVDGIDGLFQILDNQVDDITGVQLGTLQRWLSSAYPGA